MNARERIIIGDEWIDLAEMYGTEIKPNGLAKLLDAVSDLPAESVLKVLKEWPKTSKLLRHPMPIEIRQLISPEPPPEAKGREILSRIQEGVRKLGYTAAWADVESFIGPAGAQIVRERGGWYKVCVEEDIFDPFIASQIRERAKDIAAFGADALENFDKPQLESATKEKPQLTSAGDIMKTIMPKEPQT